MAVGVLTALGVPAQLPAVVHQIISTENGAAQVRQIRAGEGPVQGPVLNIEHVTLILVQVSYMVVSRNDRYILDTVVII